MKKTLVAILALVAFSCQKETTPSAAEDQVQMQTLDAQQSAVSLSLSNDQDFIKLVSLTQPVARAFAVKRKFPEFKDEKLLFSECSTLYSKMGFKDSSQCVQWFLTAYELSTRIAKKYPNATEQDYTGAFTDPKTACQDKATGTFLMDMAKCATFGLLPIVGPALAGTCMIGALVNFNGSMAACETPEA